MEIGLYATCNQCGHPLNRIFTHKGDLIEYIIKNPKCLEETCNTSFKIISDGRIWNLNYNIIPSKEEFILALLTEIRQSETQSIFGYEDIGPEKKDKYRYPSKRFKFGFHHWTKIATPACYLHIYHKDEGPSANIEKSYCFELPSALLQIAREALKGYYWLVYEKKVDL